MTGAASHTDLSPQAFLAWEEQQPERFEHVGGVVRMMAGGTLNHDRIGANIIGELHGRLRGSTCAGHGSNLKIVSPHGDVFYPDALVRCGPADGHVTSISDPVVVVEVLSESTAMHDLTRKRLAYKTIPTLRAIVYVSPDRARVDVVRRQPDGRWEDEAAIEGLDGELALPEIIVSISMAEIYAGTAVAAVA